MSRDTKSQFYRWVFTLDVEKIYVAPERIVSILTSLLCKNYVFQLEKGLLAGKSHYQGRFTLKTKRVKSSLLTMMGLAYGKEPLTSADIAIWCKGLRLAPEHDAEASVDYVMKDETRIAGPWAFPAVYRGQDLIIGSIDPKYHWQQELTAMFDSGFGSDSRKIIYIYDPVGNTGKSTFIKRMLYTNENDVALLTTTFNPVSLVSSLIVLGPRLYYLADFPRVKGDVSQLLSVCEGLKNGLLVSSMYGRNEKLMMMPPTVCISPTRFPI